MKRLFYIIPLLLLIVVSCRDFHVTLSGDAVLAEVGSKTLLQSELESALPKEYRGSDSVAFAEVFIDKWVLRQIKLREAERLYSSSEADIEAMVEDYRQLLLIRRLDEDCVRSSSDTVYTDSEIEQYYQRNLQNFPLSHDIAKGQVLRIPLKDSQTKKLVELLGQSSESAQLDLLSICQKNEFEFVDYTTSWVDVTKILDLLPLVRGDKADKLLLKSGVNSMKDENYDYYYKIVEYKKAGDTSPLEWVRSTIRTILITERQQTLIHENEQSLYYDAVFDGSIKLQYQSR